MIQYHVALAPGGRSTLTNVSSIEVCTGQRWTASNGVDPDVRIAGRATLFDGWVVTWPGGPRGGELWLTSAILEHYVLAQELKRARHRLTSSGCRYRSLV